jgi:hypothetical protein
LISSACIADHALGRNFGGFATLGLLGEQRRLRLIVIARKDGLDVFDRERLARREKQGLEHQFEIERH